jgi:tetratricopeptide (TPR) repeat protein
LERDPEHLGALEVAAQSLVALGHAEECLAVVRSLVRLNPHEPAYELWRASSLQILARHSEALTAFSRAYRLYKDPMIQAKVLEEMELLIGLLEMGGREPTQLWLDAGLVPPQKRRGARESLPTVH